MVAPCRWVWAAAFAADFCRLPPPNPRGAVSSARWGRVADAGWSVLCGASLRAGSTVGGRRGALRVLMFERGGVGVSALGVCGVFVKWQVVVACPAMTTRVRCAHTTSPRPVSLRLLRARRPLRCRVLCRLLG